MEPFLPQLNPHYDFSKPENLAEIERQQKLLAQGLMSMTPYTKGGGDVAVSPWGSNTSLDAGDASSTTIHDFFKAHSIQVDELINAETYNPSQTHLEFCIKELIVESGRQLSLQRHVGREEYWVVKEGLLTVIVDSQLIDIVAGQAIFIPKGAVHSMNNTTHSSVKVIELQAGICREEDNIRLVDATVPNPRPTYPLTTENEFRSAQLFANVAIEIARTRSFEPSHCLTVLAA